MGKIYQGRKGARDLARDAHEGMRVYYINDHANMPGQFEAQTYSTLVCTGRGGFKGGWMFAHGSDHHGQVYGKGNIAAEDAVLYMGGVSTTPPPGLRELASPEPDARDEGHYKIARGQEYRGVIHKDDIGEMGYLAAQAAEREVDDRRTGKRRFW